MKGVVVEKKDAEVVRRRLAREQNFDSRFRVKRFGDRVVFPVLRKVSELKNINSNFELSGKNKSFEELLAGVLSKGDLRRLRRAYEVIGDIAIIEIDEGFPEKKIANALLKSNKNIRTVVKKIGNYEGEFRLRKHKFLAGRRKKETIHKENSVAVMLNIDKTYFSARLSNERLHIAKEVRSGEIVLVMFSGVGIYPLVISKNSNAKKIYGIEVNPTACEYAKENLRLNKMKNVELFCGDVRKVIPRLKVKFDRIIMPHPHAAVEFLIDALKVLKKNGIIHLYAFLGNNEIEYFWKRIEGLVGIRRIDARKCCQVGPGRYRVCFEFQVL